MAFIGNDLSTIVKQGKSTYKFVCTEGQTSFSGSDANGLTLKCTADTFINVYLNGVRLIKGDDFTLGTDTLTLLVGGTLSDELLIVADIESAAFNTYTKSETDDKLNLKADQSVTYTKTEVDNSFSNTTSAFQSYTDNAVAALVDSSPAALDTLNELATALGNDANFSTTVTNSLATKAPLASPNFTGTATMNGVKSSGLNGAYPIQFDSNNGGYYPSDSFGGSLGYNSTSGGAEVDFWNTWTGASATQGGFLFNKLTGTSTSNKLMHIRGDGDVSFYEDTGTAVKFFWDASAESLGVGHSSPIETLHVDGGVRTESYTNNAHTIEFPAFFNSGVNHVVATVDPNTTNTGTVVIATLEFATLYSYAGSTHSMGTIWASARRITNGTAWRELNQATVNVGDTSFTPGFYWDTNTGSLMCNVGGSVQVTGKVTITYHNCSVNRDYSTVQ